MQPLHYPVSQFDWMQIVAIGCQCCFLFFLRQDVFVEYTLVWCARLIVLAGKTLFVFALDFVDEHFARSEEVAEIRPLLAKSNQII